MEPSKKAINQEIMLSIIIPYFKIAFFEETLSSLANQTCKNFTVYVGDDASPENPKKLIERYRQHLNLTYKRFSENIGSKSLTDQWERCISLTAEEEWILILGDDDYLENGVIEEFYRNLKVFQKKTNIVRFASQTIYQSTNESSSVYKHPKWEEAQESQYRRMLGLTRSTLSEYVFKKEIYTKKGFRNLPLAWHSDDLAWLDFSENKPIFSINSTTVYVRNSYLNISSKKDNLDLKEKATLEFYMILINEKSHLYTKDQIGVILKRYEELKAKRNELNMEVWQFLFFTYLFRAKLINFLRFLRRSVKKKIQS